MLFVLPETFLAMEFYQYFLGVTSQVFSNKAIVRFTKFTLQYLTKSSRDESWTTGVGGREGAMPRGGWAEGV